MSAGSASPPVAPVEIGGPHLRGELVAGYDRQAGCLVAESSMLEAWTYGVNLAGIVTLDFADDGLLKNVDVRVNRKLWRADRDVFWPADARKGSICLSVGPSIPKSQNRDLAVNVSAAEGKTLVRVNFGDGVPGPATAVALSASCVALVNDRALHGFVFRIDA